MNATARDLDLLRQRIKECVIAWLDAAYDEDNRMGSNPDYRNEREVDELVTTLVAAVAGKS